MHLSTFSRILCLFTHDSILTLNDHGWVDVNAESHRTTAIMAWRWPRLSVYATSGILSAMKWSDGSARPVNRLPNRPTRQRRLVTLPAILWSRADVDNLSYSERTWLSQTDWQAADDSLRRSLARAPAAVLYLLTTHHSAICRQCLQSWRASVRSSRSAGTTSTALNSWIILFHVLTATDSRLHFVFGLSHSLHLELLI